ncbi:hypothetical protein [Thomasclavelia sp.]
MKLNRRLAIEVVIVILLSKVSSVSAYNGTENTNLSGGIVLLFIPVMLGIIYLAGKGEVK